MVRLSHIAIQPHMSLRSRPSTWYLLNLFTRARPIDMLQPLRSSQRTPDMLRELQTELRSMRLPSLWVSSWRKQSKLQ
jgi:hypothetical protein